MKVVTHNWTVLFATFVSSAVDFTGNAIPYVQTTSGIVIGQPARNKSGVVEFLGIRYAQATNRSLRFQPPVPFISSDTYKASHYSPKRILWSIYGGSSSTALNRFMQLNTHLTSFPRACPFNPAPPLSTFPNKSSTFDRIYAIATGGTSLEFSEDCLALNIWTSSISPKELKPVSFFIHGGRFVSGSTNNTFYEGQYLAATGDLVVVAIEHILFSSNLSK